MNLLTTTPTDPAYGDVVGGLFLLVGLLVAAAIIWAAYDGWRAFRREAREDETRDLAAAFGSVPVADRSGAVFLVPMQREPSDQS